MNQLSAKLLKLLVIILIVIAVLLVLARLSLSTVIRFAASEWFEEQGLEFSVDDVAISFLKSDLNLSSIRVKSDTNELFSLERIHIDWQWKPMADNVFVIDDFALNELKIYSAVTSEGDVVVSGINTSANAHQQTTDREDVDQQPDQISRSHEFIVKKLSITNITSCTEIFDDNNQLKNHYCLTIGGFEQQGSLNLKITNNETSPAVELSVPGQLLLSKLSIDEKVLNRNLLMFDLFKLSNINYNLDALDIDLLELNGLSALERELSKEYPEKYLLQFDSFTIQPISFVNQSQLTLGTISLLQPEMFFAYHKNGESDIQVWLQGNGDTETDSNQPEDASESSVNVKLDEIKVNTTRSMRYVDDRPGQEVSVELTSLNLSVNNIDTTNLNQTTSIVLDLAIQDHATLDLNLAVSDLDALPSFKGKVDIKGLDLRMLNNMTKQHIGHHVKSGQLDSEVDINVNKGKIESQLALVLNQFKLKGISEEEAEALNSEFGFPLNSTLSLLRDRDNAIRLSIPVSGNLDNPEFNPRDAVVKASSKAITAAVLHYYSPFGLVFAAESLFDLATALRFDPVIFMAGNAELDADAKVQLDKLAQLLHERPGIHLTLCGMASANDIAVLFPQQAQQLDSGDDKTTDNNVNKLTDIQNKNLMELADLRSSNVKAYLVGINKKVASRLVVCSAEYDEESQPSVLISL